MNGTKVRRRRDGDEIMKVHLHFEHDGRHDFYFRCAKHVYNKLTPQLIGLTYQSLLNLRMKTRRFYANGFCTIEIVTID